LLERRAIAEARRPIPEGWLAVVRTRLPYIAALPPEERDRLLHHARGLLTTLIWEGAGGLALTEDMRLVIAAQAALLTWKRSDLPFPRLKTVVVYPTTFRSRPAFAWVAGPPRHEAEPPTLGQSWSDGSIVLAWDDVLHGAAAPHDGHNVVLHEFAHQLDSADGLADGVPALPPAVTAEAWQHTLLRAYDQLEREMEAGASSPIDAYGLTNRAEFFAVATESFFERPGALRQAYPELYDRLAGYYSQDPARLSEG
jgi:Mlc titration factor MtfA (ptsG expression regulator)